MSDDSRKVKIQQLAASLAQEIDAYLKEVPGGTATGGAAASDSSGLLKALRSDVEKSGEIIQRFLGSVESMADIVPDEEKRYIAAFKSLASAMGLTRKDIAQAADQQIAELKKKRESFSDTLSGRRTELAGMQDRRAAIKPLIEQLQSALTKIQGREKDFSETIKAEERGLKEAEDGYEKILKDIEKDVTDTKNKILRYISEGPKPAAPEPAPPAQQKRPSPQPQQQKARPAAPADPGVKDPFAVGAPSGKGVRSCPVCSSEMDFYGKEKSWKCYVCGHEEHKEG